MGDGGVSMGDGVASTGDRGDRTGEIGGLADSADTIDTAATDWAFIEPPPADFGGGATMTSCMLLTAVFSPIPASSSSDSW
jgi:hypothetical protein